MKKKIAITIICIMALFVASLSLAGCSGKKVPVYTGMTVGSTRSMSAPMRTELTAEGDSFGWGEKDEDGNYIIPDGMDEDNSFDKDVKDEAMAGIDVIASDKVEHYASPNSDIFINIHINNPAGFVILRFTLNGTIYQSYQFEDGSTSELIILKVRTGPGSGITEYTIDAIKYIDDADNLNKDVDMTQANKTVKVGVRHTSVPSALVYEVDTAIDSAEVKISVVDPKSLIGDDKANFYLYDGKSIIKTVPVKKGLNTVTLDGLNENKTYQYAVIGIFDILDGEGEHAVSLADGTIKTKAYFSLETVTADKESIAFTFSDYKGSTNAFFECFALHDSQGKAIMMNEDINELEFTGLLSDTEYTVALYYGYEVGGKTYRSADKRTVKTVAKQKPEIELVIKNVNKTGFAYEINSTDHDGVLSLDKMTITSGEEKVKEITDIEPTGVFNDLRQNTAYELVLNCSYDLNDGAGKHSITLKNNGARYEDGTLVNPENMYSDALAVVSSGDKVYALYVGKNVDWEKAVELCKQLGGHLVTITSDDELETVQSVLSAEGNKYGYSSWVGGYFEDGEGHWITDEEFVFNKNHFYYSGTIEPKDGEMLATWFDSAKYWPCDGGIGEDESHGYIVEVEKGGERYWPIVTQAMAIGAFEIKNLGYNNGVITFDVKKTDTDNVVSSIEGIVLVKDGEEVGMFEYTEPTVRIEGMDKNCEYDVRIKFVCDFNDGSDATTAYSLPAYVGCYDFTFEVENGNAIVKSIDQHVEELVFPTYVYRNGEKYAITDFHCDCYNNQYLTKVTLPEKIKEVKGQMFRDCAYLTQVDFGEHSEITKIDHTAFYCSKLQEVRIPASVVEIGDYAFAGNPIGKLTFEEGSQLKVICKWAFADCAMEYVVVPGSVETIGELAFTGNNLKGVVIPASVKRMGNNIVSGAEGAVIYCESEQAADGWGNNWANNLTVLYKGQWHFDDNGIPCPNA